MLGGERLSEPSFSVDVKFSNKGTSKFEHEVIDDTYEWWVENVLSVFWAHDEFSLKPAKSTEYGYVDVPYPMHILTNFTAMMSVVDHSLLKKKKLPDDLEKRLRRAGTAYALHDYNKLVDSKVSMEDIDDELPEVIDELGKAKEDSVFYEFSFDTDAIKTLILSTEKSTTELELRYDVSMPDLKFEINLMKICDSDFGGIFDPKTTLEDIVDFTESAWQRLWGEGTYINYVKLSPSMMHSTRSVVQITISKYLGHSDEHTLVANSGDGIVFFGPQIKEKVDEISSLVKEYLYTRVKPERDLKPGAKKIDISPFKIVPPKKSHLKEFIKEETNIEGLFNFSSLKSGKERMNLEGFGQEGFTKAKEFFNSEFQDKGISIQVNQDKNDEKTSLQLDPETLTVEHEEFLLISGILRLSQLILSKYSKRLTKKEKDNLDGFKDSDFFKDMKDKCVKQYSTHIEKEYGEDVEEKYKKSIKTLFYCHEYKSTILCFFLAEDFLRDNGDFVESDFDINEELENLFNAIKKIESSLDIERMITDTLSRLISFPSNKQTINLDFDSVPKKEDMCLVTGGAAKEEAVKDYLQGVNTQTFTNRAPIVLGDGKGKVSEEVMLESVLRKKSMDVQVTNSSLVYAQPPGISPNINVGAVLSDVLCQDESDSEGDENDDGEEDLDENDDGEEDKLVVSSLECSIKNDSALYTTMKDAASNKDLLAKKDMLDQVNKCLKLAKQTKLQVFLRMTNELLNPDSDYIFSTTIPSPVVKEMGYDQVKLSELNDVVDEMEKLRCLGEGKYRVALEDGVTSFIDDPLSLFTLAEVSDKGDIRSNGENAYEILENRGVDMDEMKEVAKAAYSVQDVAGDSRTDRTWLFTEPIDEVINVELQSGENQKDFEDLVPAIAGHIQQRAKNREEAGNIPPAELEKASLELAKKIVWFINKYWDGNIPQDERMRNATNAFQFLFAHLCYEKGEWNL